MPQGERHVFRSVFKEEGRFSSSATASVFVDRLPIDQTALLTGESETSRRESWIGVPIAKMQMEYEKSVQQYPNILSGAADGPGRR
jgi:hypothetical protein